MIKGFFVSFLLFISFSGFGQRCFTTTKITTDNLHLFFESNWSGNGCYNYTNDHVLPFQIARKFYPELNDINIDIVFKSIKTTMAARPKLSFLFISKDKRKYKIIINNDYYNYKGVRFEELSLNAKVGVFGHELAHILDYENKSRWKILQTGVKYLSKKGKRKLESDIDYIAIERGLGWQIFDFSDYVLNRSDCCPDYKKFKEEFYFNPGEIFFFIDQMKYNY